MFGAAKAKPPRSLMRRRGVEDIKGGTPIVAPLVNKQTPRRKLSKAELRQQAEAAFRAWRAGQTRKCSNLDHHFPNAHAALVGRGLSTI